MKTTKARLLLIVFVLAWLFWPEYKAYAANPFSKLWDAITRVVTGRKKPVCAPLTIVTTTLPSATVGQPYFVQLQAKGGVCGNKCCP